MSKSTIKRPHRQYCLGDLSRKVMILDRNIQVPEFDDVDFDEKFSGTLSVWASVTTVSGQTIFVVNQDVSYSHRIAIRYDASVNSEKWIRLDGINYRIIDIQNLEMRNEWLVMRCVATGIESLEASKA